jgi:hypothetical protein
VRCRPLLAPLLPHLFTESGVMMIFCDIFSRNLAPTTLNYEQFFAG